MTATQNWQNDPDEYQYVCYATICLQFGSDRELSDAEVEAQGKRLFFEARPRHDEVAIDWELEA